MSKVFDFSITEEDSKTLKALEELAKEYNLHFDYITALLTIKFIRMETNDKSLGHVIVLDLNVLRNFLDAGKITLEEYHKMLSQEFITNLNFKPE